MAQEQVGEEEQRHRIAMHRHPGKGIPESLTVRRALSKRGAEIETA
jgi:hypothetical protein